MKKTLLQRFGALALCAMMAFGLMATPAMAAGEKQAPLTINNAMDKATYKIVELMTLKTAEKEDGTITGYEYTLAGGDVGQAVREVISHKVKETDKAGEFQAVIENNVVTRTGFQLAGDNRVVFRVKTEGTQTVPDAYAAWSTSTDGQAFMLKFSDRVKEKLEADGFNLDSVADKVKDAAWEGDTPAEPAAGYVADTNSAKGVIGVNLDYGYYMVVSGVGQRAIICTNPVVGGATINEKNQAPTLEKKVYESADGSYTDKSDGNIGDLVYFQATIDAGTGLNHLTFKDTLSPGLDFVALTDVTFYPRSDETGVDFREVYLNAMDGDTNLGNDLGGKTSLLPDTTDPVFNWTDPTNEALKGITLATPLSAIYIDASRDGRNLTVDFDEIFLLSKRASSTDLAMTSKNRNDYTCDPIYKDDTRVAEADRADAGKCAMYNQYLGDMSKTTDDGGRIVIKYVARLNSDAKIGQDGNENTAKLEYGNDPTDNPLYTPEEKTRTYVYELDVLKHMTGDEDTKLAGAEFELRRAWLDLSKPNAEQLAAGTITVTDADIGAIESDPIHFVELEDGYYRVKVDGEAVVEGDTKLVSDDQGSIRIKGLDADLYSLTETKAPDGYILADKPVYAVIGSVYAGTAEVKADKTVVMSVYTQNKDNKNQFDAVKEGTPAVNTNRVKIENASGLRMPETGGIGTTIFYVVGVVLVLGAGVLLVVKKRVGRDGE